MSLNFYILLFVTMLATKLGTDLYCVVARRFEIVDKPDHRRKLQEKAVPVGGGAVIWLVLLSVSFLIYCLPTVNLNLPQAVPVVIFASLVLVAVGLYDDKYGMNGRWKLLFQIMVATLIISFAKSYSSVSLFGYTFDLGHLFYPAAIFWLIGLINSLNLLDGADGALTSLGFYMLLAAAGIGVINGNIGVYHFALIAAASLAGFFLCNSPPAKVYLGDTGSMLIGLLVGILLLRASITNDHSIALIPVICVVLIPILDSVFAIIRRKNARRSIFSADRGHIHHRIQKHFGRGNILLLILSALQIPLCIAAVLGVYYRNDLIPLGAIIFFFLLLVTTGILGRNEIIIFSLRLNNFIKKRFYRTEYNKSGVVFHTQGTVNWALLWKRLLSQGKKMQVVYISLDINIPSIDEDYHTEWHDLSNDSITLSRFSIPILREQQFCGTLTVHFDANTVSLPRSSDTLLRLAALCDENIAQLPLDKSA